MQNEAIEWLGRQTPLDGMLALEHVILQDPHQEFLNDHKFIPPADLLGRAFSFESWDVSAELANNVTTIYSTVQGGRLSMHDKELKNLNRDGAATREKSEENSVVGYWRQTSLWAGGGIHYGHPSKVNHLLCYSLIDTTVQCNTI
ncbi:hypothetical protein Fmac_009630 [Flemingia macrophylla]|uniref:Uncharacterized protein n=1 Tax=Flemingia macrophylla TaxID=520843 RepID=A0ABD1N3D1_9FABA